ncbi:MAG: hypothetical protein ACI8ZB_005509 [Desulforhopalus sp.]|jgi:hypothetical protein
MFSSDQHYFPINMLALNDHDQFMSMSDNICHNAVQTASSTPLQPQITNRYHAQYPHNQYSIESGLIFA